MQLKERQFEPTGRNLGEFLATDLESFDLTYKDSDEEDSQDGNSSSGGSDKKSKVPDPVDDNPLGKDKKSSSSSSSGGSDSSQGGQSSQDSQEQENQEDDEPEGVSDIPDEWDPYGENLDDQDPDMPDDNDNSGDGQSSSSGGGGASSSGGGSSSDEDNDIPSQVPNQSRGDDTEDDNSDTSLGNGQGSGDDESGEGESEDSGDSNDGDFDDLLNDYEEDSQDGNSSSGGSDDSDDDSEDLLDAPKDSSELGQSSNNSNNGRVSRSNNGGDSSSDDGSSDDNSGSYGQQSGQSGGSSSSNSGNINGDNSSNLDYDKDQVPSDEELEAEDDDFDPSDLGTLSDLEKALESIDQQSADSVKERRKSENNRNNQEESNRNSSQKDRDDEIAAAKDIVGKAAKDTQSDDIMNGKGDEDEDDDDYGRRYNRDKSESQDDILKDLGAGNLTTLFNPGNLQDWRSRLDKIFDKALGFDIVTNPNLTNKKIEDAPPGREDEIPQIKNIAILLDMSASMGAREFKQVIMHIDTMIKARKLTKVWFHIIGFGSSNINDIGNYYSRVKGSRLKQEMMTKFKNDAGWMTDFLPGVVFAAHKVHKPDAVIIMTDAEFNGSLDKFKKDSKASMFMKKNKNKIIWALTKNARLQYVKDYDPTAIAKKRYIKFKKGGHERDDDDWN